MKVNKFYTGESLEFLKKIEDESIDFILTDPPYNITEEVSIIRRSNAMKYKGNDIDFEKHTSKWDKQWNTKKEFREFIKKNLKEYYRILKANRHLIIFCDKRDISAIQDMGEEIGFKVRQLLIWQKSNPVPRARGVSPINSFETIVWLTKGKSKKEFYNRKLGMVKDIFTCPIPRKEGGTERHPTQKPMFLLGLLILLFSKKGDLILDSFAGSGNMGIVAECLGRRYILNELDEK